MSPKRLAVYYDGDCRLCQAAADAWREVDRTGRLDLRPLQEPLPADAPAPAELSAEIHVHGDTGWLHGARAILAIYERLPGGWPVSLALRLGIALGVADPIYRFVARHRQHLPAVLLRRRAKP